MEEENTQSEDILDYYTNREPEEVNNAAEIDPIKEQEDQGNSFWENVRNLSPTAVVDQGTPAGKLAKDLVTGIASGEVPKQMGIGLMQVAEGTANFVTDMAGVAEDYAADLGLGDGDLIDEDSHFKMVEETYGEPTTDSQKVARFIGRYVLTFGAINVLAKGSKVVKASKALAGASVLSAVAIDPKEERLADILEAYPQLSTPMSRFLATDPKDTEVASRLKNAAESVVVDALMGAVGFGFVGSAKMAKKLAKQFMGSVDAVKQSKQLQKKIVAQGKAGPGAEVVPEPPKIDPAQVKGELGIEVPGAEPKLNVDVEGKSVRNIMDEADAKGIPLTEAELHQVAKRNIVSDKEAKKLAKATMESPEATEEIIKRKLPKLIDQKELHAIHNARSVSEVEMISSIPKDIDNATEAEMILFMANLDRAMEIRASLDAGMSEAGRMFRSKRILDEGSVTGMALDEYLKLRGGNEGIKETMKMLQQAYKVSKSGTGGITKKLSKSLMKRRGDALFEYWINNILSGTTTHIKNVVSNTASAVSFLAESAIVEAITFGADGAKVNGQTYAAMKGMIDGLMEGVGNAKMIMKGEMPASNLKIPDLRKSSLNAQNVGLDPDKWFGKVFNGLAKINKLPGKALVAEDAVFRTANYRARVYQLTHREMMERGLKRGSAEYNEAFAKGIASPPESIVFNANKVAEENIFVKDLKDSEMFAGDTLAGLETALRTVPGGLGRIVAPFMRISGNLADFTVQRTPFVNRLSPKMVSDFSAGGLRQKEAQARLAVGTGVLLTGGALAYGGYVTGHGPADKKLKKAMDFKEHQIAGVPLDSFGPYGAMIAFSADIAELAGKLNDEQSPEIDELAGMAAMLTAELLTPDTMSDNLPSFFNILSDIQDGKLDADGVMRGAAKLSSTMIPLANFWKQSGRMFDRGKKSKEPEQIYPFYMNLWGRMKAEWLETVDVFGYADMPPQRNIFGEEVFYPPGLGQGRVSDIWSDREPKDPAVENEIIRLEMAGKVFKSSNRPGNTHLNISMPSRVINKGVGSGGTGKTFAVTMPPKLYDKYVKWTAGVGERVTLRDEWSKLIKNDSYKKMSDERKRFSILRILDRRKQRAMEKVKHDTDIRQQLRDNESQQRESLKRPELQDGEKL